jgi:hypothetical protein
VRHWSTSRPKSVLLGLLAGFLLLVAVIGVGGHAASAAAPVLPVSSRALARAAILPATRIPSPPSPASSSASAASAASSAAPAVAASGASSASSSAAAASSAVVIALLPSELSPTHTTVESVLDRLAGHPALALGMASATQAIYDPAQALLDISQGARIQMNRYSPSTPPELDLDVASHGPSAIGGWPLALARASTAPATALPGLLAGSVPGGAAFVGIYGGPYAGIPTAVNYFRNRPWRHPGAIIAADRTGAVAAVSIGTPATLVDRTQRALGSRRLVVVELSAGDAGDAQLGALLADRQPRQLVVALQSPPELHGSQTLWLGLAGDPSLVGRGGTLTSGSTHVPGMVEATDITATTLRALGLPIPSQVQGQPITAGGSRDPQALKDFRARIGVVNSRQLPSLETFLLAWAGLLLTLGIVADRRGLTAGLRAGGLAALWIPSLALLTAVLRPTRLAELAVIAGGSLALGLITDRVIGWPRAPVVPAVVGLVAYTIDLARGSRLIDDSVFGPSPLAGVRFYGVDNDLEIVSTLLVLALVAATMRRRDRSVRSALILVACGLAAALVVCPGRLGADVGGIFTIAAGFGVAALMMLPRITWRAVVLALVAPAVALVGLVGVDKVTKGNSDFLRNVVDAPHGSDVWDIVQRRYDVAWSILRVGEIPLLTLLALLGATYAVRHRRRVFAAIAPDALWPACLAGGFAAALSCAVFNDSGASELILGTGGVACLCAYVRAPPIRIGDPLAATSAGEPAGSGPDDPAPPVGDPDETALPAGDNHESASLVAGASESADPAQPAEESARVVRVQRRLITSRRRTST